MAKTVIQPEKCPWCGVVISSVKDAKEHLNKEHPKEFAEFRQKMRDLLGQRKFSEAQAYYAEVFGK